MPEYALKDINPNPIGSNPSPFLYDRDVAINATRNLVNSKSFDNLYDETGLDLEDNLFEGLSVDLEQTIEYFFSEKLTGLNGGVQVFNLKVDTDYQLGTYTVYADIKFEGLNGTIPIKKSFELRS